MIQINQYNSLEQAIAPLVQVDMLDCYTGSFPEFMPFCSRLYYFSNFKDFNTAFPA